MHNLPNITRSARFLRIRLNTSAKKHARLGGGLTGTQKIGCFQSERKHARQFFTKYISGIARITLGEGPGGSEQVQLHTELTRTATRAPGVETNKQY